MPELQADGAGLVPRSRGHPACRESFVPLKLRSDVHEELALGFNLSGLPATIIVTPNARSSRSVRVIWTRRTGLAC